MHPYLDYGFDSEPGPISRILLPTLAPYLTGTVTAGVGLSCLVSRRENARPMVGTKKSRTRRLNSFPLGVQRRAHHRRTRTRTTSLHRGPGGEE